MGKIKKYKHRLECFVSSDRGQRFFNFAYSVGAAIVILGALFKFIHFRSGDLLLTIGMLTEVFIFMLTAFDRPSREYKWEKVYPELDEERHDKSPDVSGNDGKTSGKPMKTIKSEVVKEVVSEKAVSGAVVYSSVPPVDCDITALSAEIEQLKNDISENSSGYVEQMQALNRNLQGLNTIYEIQLKSVSSQLDAIDRVNRGIKEMSAMYENTLSQSSRYCDESEKMAEYMRKLNQVYEKMLRAMTVNMPSPEVSSSFDLKQKDNK